MLKYYKSSILSMKQLFTTSLFLIFINLLNGQAHYLTGKVTNEFNEPVDFATIALKSAKDSAIIKVEMSGADGSYKISNIPTGRYFVTVTYIGLAEYSGEIIDVNKDIETSVIKMLAKTETLGEVTVSAQRVMVEKKADRMVFNVEGTINSIGDNALGLLRKAPGVLVDNSENITVLSRNGVLIYVDGKRLPLSGSDLSNYLQNLTADQIDRIDIITNPSAKYEAEGNAGIIDIRLKRDKNLGVNANVGAYYGQGREAQMGVSGRINNKTKKANSFVSLALNDNGSWNEMIFNNFQNGFKIREVNTGIRSSKSLNLRLGSDINIGKESTIGFLYSNLFSDTNYDGLNESEISLQSRARVDSLLIADNNSDSKRSNHTFNVNFNKRMKNKTLTADLDYAVFNNEVYTIQPNEYYLPDRKTLLTKRNVQYSTPSDIHIASAKLDYEAQIEKLTLAMGAKFTKVVTDNTFLFYNDNEGRLTQNNNRSNQFAYDENVTAVYTNLTKPLNKNVNFSGGLRIEHTYANGDLTTFNGIVPTDSSRFDYFRFFPSLGFTFQNNPKHAYSINYGRRINRPDYNVLNPFKEQLSELSFSKGNAFLNPEIVNNIEAGYTYNYMYNFQLAYSITTDQITRLIGPDNENPRAGFISWDNLATQEIFSLNISAPVNITKWWNAYFNASASYTDNQATYPNGAKVDIQAGSYSFYQQHTLSLPNKWKAEVSGWYSGPGVWGGVFLFDPSYSLNLGLQRKFYNEKINARLSFSDVTFQSYWSGVSSFNGLRGEGSGKYDSRRVTLNLSYDFGNKNVKAKNRNTGIDSETKRAGN
jgi:iron complex outermembrane recepter protein